MTELRQDLDGGAWKERNGSRLDAPELDVGLRLVVAERWAYGDREPDVTVEGA